MKLIALYTIILIFINDGLGQVTLDADGPGGTYSLITSVLAPNQYPIEAPDCNHQEFGEHIDEIFDSELNLNVFRFHIHTSPDDDRCINFDRQRNEIKSYDKSPDNLLGTENEVIAYKWKFKLQSGFQSSPNFTHLHQLKSVGGSLASTPMYTLTTRKGSPDRLELRYAETDDQITLARTDLAPMIGTWLSVTEKIKYGKNGNYEIEIKRVSDDETLFYYVNDSIINWRPGADFVRPKWGIYRSLINDQDLRDETVLFANFSIEELQLSSANDLNIEDSKFIVSNPVSNYIYLSNLPPKTELIRIFSLDGRINLEQSIVSNSELELDVSSFDEGTYVLNISGDAVYDSKLIVIVK